MDITQLNKKLAKILPKVEMPGRYTGGEFNQITKNWEDIDVRVSLLFPEIYDLGMSNLGLTILYDIINNEPNYLAERSFVPWVDMEIALREENIPLYSLESKHPLLDFDILAVSLPYESLYTNFLNALDLAQIPIHASDRTEDHPLVIVGGHSTFNPEPIAPFIDAAVIGEGEEIILDILELYAGFHSGMSKLDKLNRLKGIEGLYIPVFYEPIYNEDGTFSNLKKLVPEAPNKDT